MTDDAPRSAREEIAPASEVALHVGWFADLRSGTGAAPIDSPTLRAALELATVDRAREIATSVRAEQERQEELERDRLQAEQERRDEVERNRVLALRAAFEAHISEIAGDSDFADITPASLIPTIQSEWEAFAELLDQSFSQFVEWLVQRVGQTHCDNFLSGIPEPRIPERVAVEFAVEFAERPVATFRGFPVDARSLAEVASRTASRSPGADAPRILALFRSGSLSAFARIESTGLAGVSERWERAVEEWGMLTGNGDPPDGRTLARILHPLLDRDAARSVAERALSALPLGFVEGQLAGLAGSSSVADLAIINAAGSVEAARLAPLRAALRPYDLPASVSEIRSLDDVAEVLAQDWERALIFLSSDRYAILKEFLPNAAVLPERPRRGPSFHHLEDFGEDLPEWDALLIPVLHQLSPTMSPRFRGKDLSLDSLARLAFFGSDWSGVHAIAAKYDSGTRFLREVSRLRRSHVLTLWGKLVDDPTLIDLDRTWDATLNELADYLRHLSNEDYVRHHGSVGQNWIPTVGAGIVLTALTSRSFRDEIRADAQASYRIERPPRNTSLPPCGGSLAQDILWALWRDRGAS